MGYRGPEEGKDGIAHESGQSPLVSVDRADQVLECAVDDLGPLLGVELLGGSSGALEIGEEHRDGSPFTGHRAARSSRFELPEQFGRQIPLQVLARGGGTGGGVQAVAAVRAERCTRRIRR